jgi:hypothetical protein
MYDIVDESLNMKQKEVIIDICYKFGIFLTL